MSSRLDIINLALTHCGQKAVQSETGTDENPAPEWLLDAARNYSLVVAAALEAHGWLWCRRVQGLTLVGGQRAESPFGEGWYQYQMPGGVARLVRVFEDDTGMEYRTAGNVIHAPDMTEPKIEYLERREESEWPESFSLYIGWALAAQIASRWSPRNLGAIRQQEALQFHQAMLADKQHLGGRGRIKGANRYNRFFNRSGFGGYFGWWNRNK